jgi:hypothetical protein
MLVVIAPYVMGITQREILKPRLERRASVGLARSEATKQAGGSSDAASVLDCSTSLAIGAGPRKLDFGAANSGCQIFKKIIPKKRNPWYSFHHGLYRRHTARND